MLTLGVLLLINVVEESSNVFLSERDIPSLNISDVTNYDISTNDIDVDAILNAPILFEDELAPITIRGNVSPKRKNGRNNMININDLSDVNETILGDDLVSITTNEDISVRPTSHEIKCTNDTIIKLMIESVPTTTKGLNNSGVVNVLGDEKLNTEERSVPITTSEDRFDRSPLKDLNSNQKSLSIPSPFKRALDQLESGSKNNIVSDQSVTLIKYKRTAQSLSSDWWNNPKLKILHNVCNLFAPYICDNIKEKYPDKPLQSLRILEVGCGGGFLTEGLARAGCNLVAIDINEDAIEIAKAHSENDPTVPKIKYLVEMVEEHCKKNPQKYDVVISNFVLEHVADHDYFIKCCSDCVKPGGLLFMSAMAKTFLGWLGAILILEYVLRVLPAGIHHYDQCIAASDAQRIMESHGLMVRDTKGVFYNLLTKNVFYFPTNTFAYIIFAERRAE
ncbi:hypothetical protein RN001_000109 [Aquatica leii]|uniref:Methyltransferase type 11 domain-containing protein n=1 Tax=Aquatica leii TaxID=1421715 RepID=A0AAN7PEW7_9COLE|nr:hypothetical protein RN001_000109 [Aquatica leii]